MESKQRIASWGPLLWICVSYTFLRISNSYRCINIHILLNRLLPVQNRQSRTVGKEKRMSSCFWIRSKNIDPLGISRLGVLIMINEHTCLFIGNQLFAKCEFNCIIGVKRMNDNAFRYIWSCIYQSVIGRIYMLHMIQFSIR